MRSQTRWFQRVGGVFTLTTLLFSIPVTKSFAQASLFDPAFKAGAGANGTVYSIVVQDDGKIIVGGEFTHIAGQARTNLARLNSDGQLDASFPDGTDGAIYRLLKQPDGRILVGGAFTNLQGVARQRIGRLLTNGIVDASFDAGTNVPAEFAVFSLACQSDGKILAAEFYPLSPNFSFLKRFNSDGQLDGSFAQTNVFQDWIVTSVCPRTNGSILIGGDFQKVNGSSQPGLALISTNGQLDGGFISPLYASDNSFFHSTVHSMALLSDGSLLIGGRFWKNDTTNRYAVAKLTPALDWDTNFQPDIFDPIYGVTSHGLVRTAIQQSDGKFALGGLFQQVGGYWRRNVVRLDSQGKVDPCFDPGIGLPELNQTGNEGVLALSLQSDGKIIAGGQFFDLAKSPIATLSVSNLTRLLPQTDCNMTRVHIGKIGGSPDIIIATCAPGGTNQLQYSTNLIDWVAADIGISLPPTFPYQYLQLNWLDSVVTNGNLFFRVKKKH